MRNQLLMLLVTLLVVSGCTNPVATEAVATGPVEITPSPTAEDLTVDELLALCPSSAEVAEIDADLSLSFDSDPTAGTLVCTAAEGSADLTRLQERTYQAILVMKWLNFDQPLPWTDESLYDWFVDSVDGIRFRGDIENSFCCDPENIINVQTSNLAALQTDRWIDPQSGTGLSGLMVLFVHEARHNEGYLHTCNDTNDSTISEMGAWGVQYTLLRWLALYSGPDFLTPLDTYAKYYREMHLGESDWTRDIRFCNETAITPGPTPSVP